MKQIRINFFCLLCAQFLLCNAVAAQPTELDAEQLQACAFMEPPAIVDGSYASKQVMEQMGSDVRTYAAAMQASLGCLDSAAAGAEPDAKALINQIYNNGVDQLNYIVDQYNEQVAFYDRERESSRIRNL